MSRTLAKMNQTDNKPGPGKMLAKTSKTVTKI